METENFNGLSYHVRWSIMREIDISSCNISSMVGCSQFSLFYFKMKIIRTKYQNSVHFNSDQFAVFL